MLHKPALAPAPVNQQIFDQKRSDNHTRPVVHPTALKQLAHGGVNHRVAGATFSPGSKSLFVVAPGKALILWPEAGPARLGEMVKDRNVKLAPDQLVEPSFSAFAGHLVQGFNCVNGGLAG
jgi:hypothetical protein